MKRCILPLTVFIYSGLCLTADAANFHPIIGVTSDTDATDFFPVARLIEGPGVGFDAAEPHDRTSGLTWVTNAPNGGAGDYYNPVPDPPARLVFDLGEDVALSEISYWGYADTNANGANEFNLRFATAAEGTAGFGTSITYNPVFTPTQPVTPRQSFEFSQTVVARYVELNPTDNFFNINPPGGDRIGIGEIAFEIPAITGAPDISVPAEVVVTLDADDVTPFAIAVANAGDSELTVSATGLSGPNATAFSITGFDPPIAGLSAKDISLEFDPTGLGGAVSATLTITSNDPDTPVAEILLTGQLPELGPDISVPSEIMFVGTGAAQTIPVTVTSAGRAQLDLSGATITGTNESAFSVTSLPPSIPGLAMADIEIAFDPSGLPPGPVSATVQISSNDPDTPVADVLLTGGVGTEFHTITSVTLTNSSEFFAKDNLIQGIGNGFDSRLAARPARRRRRFHLGHRRPGRRLLRLLARPDHLVRPRFRRRARRDQHLGLRRHQYQRRERFLAALSRPVRTAPPASERRSPTTQPLRPRSMRHPATATCSQNPSSRAMSK